MAIKTGGFIAARDAGQPTPAMRVYSGYPQLRLIPVGEYVIVELGSTLFQCGSNPSVGCVVGGPSGDQLYCARGGREPCIPSATRNTRVHVVDPTRHCVLDFGLYLNQPAPEYTVADGVLRIRTTRCSEEYSAATHPVCGETADDYR
jgi:hypothetical protein